MARSFDFLKQLDFLGYTVSLRYLNQKYYRSKLGGFFTIAVIILLLVQFSFSMKTMLLHLKSDIFQVVTDTELKDWEHINAANYGIEVAFAFLDK